MSRGWHDAFSHAVFARYIWVKVDISMLNHKQAILKSFSRFLNIFDNAER